MAQPQYRVNQGIDYPPDRRAEPGDLVDDLPADSIPWLLDQGTIERNEPEPKPVAPKATPPKAKLRDNDSAANEIYGDGVVK
jgi:hypothetical protein